MNASCCQNVLCWQESLLALSALQIQTPFVRRLCQPLPAALTPNLPSFTAHVESSSLLSWLKAICDWPVDVSSFTYVQECRVHCQRGAILKHFYITVPNSRISSVPHTYIPRTTRQYNSKHHLWTRYILASSCTKHSLTLDRIKCRNDINIVMFHHQHI